MTTGADLIAFERERQKTVEGWTEEHDRDHGPRRLAAAAYVYESNGYAGSWPFADGLKMRGPLRNLVRAGALYQAAIDIAEPGAYHQNVDIEHRDRVATKIDVLLAEIHAAGLS